MPDNVLIITASEENGRALINALRPDYHLFIATSFTFSTYLIEKHLIHLIICLEDVEEEGDALRYCSQLKSAASFCHIPFILVTKEDRWQMHIKSLEMGVDSYLGGAVEPEHLKAMVNNLIFNRIRIKKHWEHVSGDTISLEEVQEKEQIEKLLRDCLQGNVGNQALSVDLLANLMHMSRPTLYRKIKSITALTPNELIIETRLKYAATLLASGGYRIAEVARMAGFNSQSSFGKSFLKQFKVTPATYQRMKKLVDIT